VVDVNLNSPEFMQAILTDDLDLLLLKRSTPRRSRIVDLLRH